MVECLERLSYGIEGRWRLGSLSPAWPSDDWKISVSPAVNGYLFRIREA